MKISSRSLVARLLRRACKPYGLSLLLCLPAGLALANGWEHQAIPTAVLLRALHGDNPALQARAAVSLGVKRSGSAVPDLLRLLDDPKARPAVRGEIFRALGRIGDRRATQALLQSTDAGRPPADRAAAVRALGVLGDPAAIDRLVSMLGDDDFRVANDAIDALGAFSADVAMQALSKTLRRAPDATTRLRAIRALGRTGNAKAAPVLLEFLVRPASRAETGALVDALGWLAAPEAAGPLADLRRSTRETGLRARITLALATVRDGRAVDALIAALDDPQPGVRLLAVKGLATQPGAQRAAPGLTALYRWAREQVGANPRSARIGVTLQVEIVRSLLAIAPGAASGLFSRASRAEPLKVTSAQTLAMAHAVYERRRLATTALGYTGDPAAMARLVELARDGDARIRAAAVRSMGVLGAAGVAREVLRALRDDSAEVRWMAADVLGRIAGPDSARALMHSLEDAHSEVRRRAALSLGLLRATQARSKLTQVAAHDGSDRVRVAAEQALVLLGAGDD